MADVREVIGDYESFVADLNLGLQKAGITRREIAMMDHLCFRVESQDRFEEVSDQVGEFAVLVGEAQINGRPIRTFEFNKYLASRGWLIPYLELPAPKEGKDYPEGLEHAELVVIGSLDAFLRRHEDLEFDHSGMGKDVNPELGLIRDDLSVKFHEQQLGAVVGIEQRLGLHGAEPVA